MPNILGGQEVGLTYGGLYAHHIAAVPKLCHSKTASLLQCVHFGEVHVMVLLRPQIAQTPAAQREVHSCLLMQSIVSMTGLQVFWKETLCFRHAQLSSTATSAWYVSCTSLIFIPQAIGSTMTGTNDADQVTCLWPQAAHKTKNGLAVMGREGMTLMLRE